MILRNKRWTLMTVIFNFLLLSHILAANAVNQSNNENKPDLAENPILLNWGMEQIESSWRQVAGSSMTTQKNSSGVQLNSDLFLFQSEDGETLYWGDFEAMAIIGKFSLSDKSLIKSLLSPNQKTIYLLDRMGHLSRFELLEGRVSHEIKLAEKSADMAISHDGRYLIIGNRHPYSIVILDAETLKPIKFVPIDDGFGAGSSVSSIQTNSVRETFTIAFDTLLQVWEISYSDNPYPGFSGWEHSYQEESGDLVKSKPFPIRRLILKNPVQRFVYNADRIALVGNNQHGLAQIVDTDIRRSIHTLEQKNLRVDQGAVWAEGQNSILLTAQNNSYLLHLIDLETGQSIGQIAQGVIKGEMATHPAIETILFAQLVTPSQLGVFNKKSKQMLAPISLPQTYESLRIKFNPAGTRLVLVTEKELLFMDSGNFHLMKRLSL